MRLQVTDEDVEHYRENGFLVIDEFLDEAELEAWRAAVDDAVAARPDRRVPHRRESAKTVDAMPSDRRAWFEYYANVFTQRLFLWKTSERVKQLVFDPALAEMAAGLEDVDAVRIWQDQALVKEPWGHPTAFHIDGPIFPFNTPHCVSLWVALDDATLSNGCLAYLPGTHKEQSLRNAPIGQDLGGLLQEHPHWADIAPVFCPIPAGGAVLHNGFVAHGAGANMTPGRRRAMTVVYMEDGATYDRPGAGIWTWTAEEQARYQKGDRLDHDDQFPLVYARSASSAASAR